MATSSTNSSIRVPSQGGILEGINPTTYDPKNPIILFIIQASIVIGLTRALYWPLAKINQPPVMAEVITGILLGPSVMGRVPGFTQHVFPTNSMPPFSLAANLGLVLYLFLVGLEVDLRLIKRDWRIAVSVGTLGMILPFGLGAAIAYGLYHQFRDDDGVVDIEFSIYLLFIGVAMAITAFPVLCRILTSLNLLGTKVGVIVLSAGIGNDVVGWILLALCVTLINSGASLTALWILLVCTGYCIFVAFPVRWAFLWLLRRTGSLVNGPTQSVVAVTVILVLASAFFTQIIGVHAIFGAFLIGLICPHGIFAVQLQEKIEDLISVLLLPLYFALSGLNTNLGLLDSGLVWGYVVGICAIALLGKIVGGTVAARLNGLLWRESLAIGCLMSCKGLVELIVLNIGFQARILSQRTFTIFVVMALITTFTTTPLVIWVYPPWYRTKLQLWREGKIDWNGNSTNHHPGQMPNHTEANAISSGHVSRKLLVYLRLDSLSSLFTMASLLAPRDRRDSSSEMPFSAAPAKERPEASTFDHKPMEPHLSTVHEHRPLTIRGLRLMELSERESSITKVSEIEEFASRDPVIRAFSTFGHSRDSRMVIDGQLSVVPSHSFSDEIIARSQDLGSDFILLPWSETGTMSEYTQPFDTIASDPLANLQFTNLAVEVFRKAHTLCNVGVLLNFHALSPGQRPETLDCVTPRAKLPECAVHETIPVSDSGLAASTHYRLVVPFANSKDDLCAIRLALQIARNGIADIEILDLRTHRRLSHLDLNTERDSEFEALKAILPTEITNRIKVTADFKNVSPLDAIIATAVQYPSRETVLLLGRNSTSTGSTGDLSSMDPNSRTDLATLGPWATVILNTVIKEQSATALIVVQATRDAEEEDSPPRKRSVSAHFTETWAEASRRLSWAR